MCKLALAMDYMVQMFHLLSLLLYLPTRLIFSRRLLVFTLSYHIFPNLWQIFTFLFTAYLSPKLLRSTVSTLTTFQLHFFACMWRGRALQAAIFCPYAYARMERTTKRKNYCTQFQMLWKQEFPFTTDSFKGKVLAFCKICLVNFADKRGARIDVNGESEKYKKAMTVHKGQQTIANMTIM